MIIIIIIIIQLLAIAKTSDLKEYEMDALLTPITKEINELTKVQFSTIISKAQQVIIVAN